jgi:hypothetical protein
MSKKSILFSMIAKLCDVLLPRLMSEKIKVNDII